LFNNLQTVQTELNFHSYYFNNYSVNDEFKEIFKDVVTTCKTSEENSTVPPIAYNPEGEQSPVAPKEPNELPNQSKCNDYPIVYFIKDGKVIKAIQGTATEEELKEMLKEIGVE
ncbi:MAG: hypothetical protein K2H20_02145, partial [Bacilli bacterium]|nr:hypothetical protein [Bacilli bacterium]